MKTYKRFKFQQRGAPDFLPVIEIQLDEKGIGFKKKRKVFYYKWNEIKEAKLIIRNEWHHVKPTYGFNTRLRRQVLTFKTKDNFFYFDVSSEYPEFENSKDLVGNVKKYLNVKTVHEKGFRLDNKLRALFIKIIAWLLIVLYGVLLFDILLQVSKNGFSIWWLDSIWILFCLLITISLIGTAMFKKSFRDLYSLLFFIFIIWSVLSRVVYGNSIFKLYIGDFYVLDKFSFEWIFFIGQILFVTYISEKYLYKPKILFGK